MTTGLPGPAPQPLGCLPWPAGMLVLPDAQGADEVAAALVMGGPPPWWTPEYRFVELALEGDVASAAACITGESDVDRYNRAVLIGDEEDWEKLSSQLDGALAALVQLARFSLALDDEPPTIDGTSGEVAAVVGSAIASAALERGDAVSAVAELERAAQHAEAAGSPLLAATLQATRAELLRTALGDATGSARVADTAVALLEQLPDGGPDELDADVHLSRALARQELAADDRMQLLTVVNDLNRALRTFTRETHPELFATAQEHLALAYLSMPMSAKGDRIRIGVAVSSLRAALTVFTPESHPTAWASTQLNLANALQYLPSVHQEENLDEAVQLYEELLQHRDAATDPLGVARVLANQGNALGHLGAFAHARERLGRAIELFTSAGDLQSAVDVSAILAGVEESAAMVEQVP